MIDSRSALALHLRGFASPSRTYSSWTRWARARWKWRLGSAPARSASQGGRLTTAGAGADRGETSLRAQRRGSAAPAFSPGFPSAGSIWWRLPRQELIDLVLVVSPRNLTYWNFAEDILAVSRPLLRLSVVSIDKRKPHAWTTGRRPLSRSKYQPIWSHEQHSSRPLRRLCATSHARI